MHLQINWVIMYPSRMAFAIWQFCKRHLEEARMFYRNVNKIFFEAILSAKKS